MRKTELSKWIEETTEELIDKVIAAGGRLTAREYDELMALRGVSKEILGISDSFEQFEHMKEIAEFNRSKKEGSQA